MRVAMYVVLMWSSSLSFGGEPKAHCDIPVGDLRSLNTPDINACKAACDADAGCKAYVYPSGWGRCFLKKDGKRQATIQFYSGEREGAGVTTPKADHDHKGKDMRKVAHTKDPQSCAEHCKADAACQAYTYIAGYGDCWLKKNKARMVVKIFYCGTKG